jgi:hypothetical protein
MIQCEKCSSWYHFSCVGLNAKKASKIKEYCCSSCLEFDKKSTTPEIEDAMEIEIQQELKKTKKETKKEINKKINLNVMESLLTRLG